MVLYRVVDYIVAEFKAYIQSIGFLPSVITVIDNVDITDRVREYRLHDGNQFFHIISDIIIRGNVIPIDGLKQGMLRQDILLRPIDIYRGSGWANDVTQ
jgi:hypothetical protein